MMHRSHLTLVSGLVLALVLPACGGSSSSPTNVTPPPVVTTPPCTQTSVFQGSGSFPAGVLDAEHITTATTGRLDVTLDWTFASSDVGLYLVPAGSCTLDTFNNRSCNFLIRSDSGAKPRKVSAANLAPGNYDVLIANFGSQQESMAVQVVLSSAGCPAITNARGASESGQAAARVEGRGLLP